MREGSRVGAIWDKQEQQQREQYPPLIFLLKVVCALAIRASSRLLVAPRTNEPSTFLLPALPIYFMVEPDHFLDTIDWLRFVLFLIRMR